MLAILAESALRSLLLGSVVWVGLNLLRIRNPHVHMTSWIIVLAASLAMPLLMHWTTVTLPAPPIAAPVSLDFSIVDPLPDLAMAPLPLDPPYAFHQHALRVAVDWMAVATVAYACIAGLLLLRLALGIYLTWRLARAAKPMSEPWCEPWSTGARVKVSDIIGGPVTFGATILLPRQCEEWDTPKRRAVLAHEGAHVANRDFYILLVASLNRAVFWFSPFAWWQHARLAQLAEIISDARAIAVVEDKLSYAEILLDLVQNVRRAPAGLEMARTSTIRARVAYILGATALPARAGWRKRLWTIAAILPLAVASAVTIARGTPPMPSLTGSPPADAARNGRPQHVSFYAMGKASIFAVSNEDGDLFGQLSGQRRLRLSTETDGTYTYPAANGRISFAATRDPAPSELMLNQNGRALRASRIAAMTAYDSHAGAAQPDAGRLASYAGWYELTPSRVLAVRLEGQQLVLQETGRAKVLVTPEDVDAFADNRGDLILFVRDGAAQINQVLLQDPVSGARLAPRITAAKAQAIEATFARRLAEIPDRFREQAPVPGSKEAILRGIADMQHGTPNYGMMSPRLADNIRRQFPQLHAMFEGLGTVETIFFRGVGPGGYDIYGVKFANGSAEFRLLLNADGKTDDVLFRPEGDDALGQVAACADEASLRSRGGAPISLFLYNSSGGDIRLYALDPEGHRMDRGTIADTMSSSVLTTVGSPWVITDTSGRCLEIVLPGQRTRYHVVEGSRTAPKRIAPLAASEDTLRRYIEALGRGQPDYDQMTSEVATQTHQQLPINQAIVAKFGTLRAMSFRGVTDLGSDVYMAHFANGTAEWRISLTRDGKIERIALGPQ